MSNLPDDNTGVDENRRFQRGWLGFLRKLDPSSNLSDTDIATLKTFIAASNEILAPPEPFPEFVPYAVDVQVFDFDGVWVNPGFGSIVLVREWAAGGSGGSAVAANFTGTGGGGGAYIQMIIPRSEVGESVAVTVGIGGASVSGTIGNPGGDTSFGSHGTVYGGGPGENGGAAADHVGGWGGGFTTGATGLLASPGSLNLVHAITTDSGAPGGGVDNGVTLRAGGDAVNGGAGGGVQKSGSSDTLGGTSINGGNGGAGNSSGDGSPGQSPGGGGGGGRDNSGAGANGRVEVYVF